MTVDGERETDARSLAGQIGLARAMRKYELERIVSFHSRVNAAARFAKELPGVIAWLPRSSRPSGHLWSRYVSGAMSSGLRDARLRHLRALGKGERGLLSNARCLGEGVDVPTLDGVAFIDPRRSIIEIIQAVGRAIRKAPDKKVGTIVIPVFVDEEADPEQALDDSAFKHVWDVLKALRAHDETLGEELDEWRSSLGALRPSGGRPGRIKVYMPVGVAFAKAFDARLVDQTTSSWEFYFGLLERFGNREGHTRVHADYREDSFPLGRWVVSQRVDRHGTLTPERRTRLEELPGWTWDPYEDDWEEGFDHLQRFIERERHARVPQQHQEDGFRLGIWVAVQRREYRKGSLSPERQVRLEALRGWSWDARHVRWEEGFAHLQQFVERVGDARVPKPHREDGYPLGNWVAFQRRRYQRGTLGPERRSRLEELPGWTWDAREAAWEEGFVHLERFVEREGDARVPSGTREDGYPLGQWVSVQRTAHRDGALKPERCARLERLKGWVWDPYESDWLEGFTRLQAFAKREGHSRVPADYRDDGYRLGRWVIKQRAGRKRGDLSSDRSHRLEALPGWTWSAKGAE